MRLMKALSISSLSAAALIAAAPALAQAAPAQSTTPAPTPAPIPVQPTAAPTTTVAQALSAQTDHTTLVKLVETAGLTPVLSGAGPVTIFAPDDAAFGRLGGAVQQLLDPANVSSAKQIAKYHIVQGSYPAKELLAQLKAKGGTMTLNTLDNQPLTLTLQGESAIELTDAKGGKAYVSKLSDEESNGVIEYINGVLSPNMVAQPPAPATPGAATTTPAPDAAATPTDDTSAADSGDTGDQDDDSSAS
jgi:uncharacterized surface protein with fasciclin (FAS1) repeats